MGRLSTFSVKIPRELRERMRKVDVDWAEYIREVIKSKVMEEERMRAVEELDVVRARVKQVATDEIVSWIREDRHR